MTVPRHHQTDVGTSATPIEGTQYPGWVLYHNGTNPVFLGSSSVLTTDGYPVDVQDSPIYRPDPSAYVGLRGKQSDRLYGIVASGTEDVRVLLEGRVNP